MNDVMWWVTVLVVFVVLLVLFSFAARRFEARQRKLGRWDRYGPLIETEAPPPKRDYWGTAINERLEVIGKWSGRVLRRREPNEKP